ncbi:hypothetical protein U2242_15330, partial [Listeria monocytogenes]|uniref:hypothetical protein n=1 Tax=Listeria monocytogenes TaxID=1639 RepID=UPI002FDC515E
YVLTEQGKTDVDLLKPIVSKALIAVSGIEQALTDPAKAAVMSNGGFDLSKLPAGTDVFTVLSALPGAMRTNILDSM